MVLITVFAHLLFFFFYLFCFAFELWHFPIYCECELLIWYMICYFSVGYLFTLLIVKETTISLCCLRNLVNFIWLCILEFTWGSLFWYLGLWICFHVSIMQLWFLYLCKVFWNQQVRNSSLFSFCLLESLVVPYSGLAFSISMKMTLIFWLVLHEFLLSFG